MHILFVLEYFWPHVGGVETLFFRLTKEIAKRGNQVTVLTNRYDISLASTEIIDGVRIKRIRFYNRYLFTFFAWIPGLKLARQADIIHTTSYNAALPGYLLKKIFRKKIVITFHEYWGQLWYQLPWMNRPMKVLHACFERCIVSLSFDKFVAVSDYTRQCLINSGKVVDSKIVRIYNGIDYSERDWRAYRSGRVKKPARASFLYFGRVGYSKGLDILIHALSLLSRKDRDRLHLELVIPREHLYDRVTELIARHDLDHCITIRHSVDFETLLTKIGKSDAVIIPSYSEGFCFAAVEAMAVGTPIISSGKGALAEVIGGTYIQASEHSPEGMSKALKLALAGTWSSKPKRRYPIEETMDRYMEVYQQLLV